MSSYYEEPEECKICMNNGNDYCFACDNGNQFKPMTHYDRLVSKTPEELAKTIVGWLADAAELCGENRQEFDIPKAEEYTVSWLKSPAEEE